MSFTNLTPAQLRQAGEIKEKIEAWQKQLDAILAGDSLPAPVEPPESESSKPTRKKHKFSAAGLARLRAAQKARWAKVKAGKPAKAEKKTRRKMSAAGRAAIAAGAKARWAKAKAAKAV